MNVHHDHDVQLSVHDPDACLNVLRDYDACMNVHHDHDVQLSVHDPDACLNVLRDYDACINFHHDHDVQLSVHGYVRANFHASGYCRGCGDGT
jgi:hypothetical protein